MVQDVGLGSGEHLGLGLVDLARLQRAPRYLELDEKSGLLLSGDLGPDTLQVGDRRRGTLLRVRVLIMFRV